MFRLLKEKVKSLEVHIIALISTLFITGSLMGVIFRISGYALL